MTMRGEERLLLFTGHFGMGVKKIMDSFIGKIVLKKDPWILTHFRSKTRMTLRRDDNVGKYPQ